jgi:uncharacterized protein (TIGR03435 family)
MKTSALTLFAVVLTLAAAPAKPSAQSATDPLTFEVASVKPSAPDTGSPISSVPMMLPSPGGGVRGQNLPLRLLVRMAYKLQDEQLVGGPAWQLSDKFDINARPADGAAVTEDALRARMQALLADRFKLKVHSEMREMAVSALVLAKKDRTLGPSLRPSTADCSDQAAEAQRLGEEIRKNPANAQALLAQVKCGLVPTPQLNPGSAPQLMFKGLGQPMASLAVLLTQFVGRTVVDKTELTGTYDFEMEVPLDLEMLRRVAGQAGMTLPVTPNMPQYDGPAIGTILQDRLGLKLDSQKASVTVLVIDSAEKPAAD